MLGDDGLPVFELKASESGNVTIVGIDDCPPHILEDVMAHVRKEFLSGPYLEKLDEVMLYRIRRCVTKRFQYWQEVGDL